MAVCNARVFPPFVTVDLLSSVFKSHSMYLDFISFTRVFMSTFRSCTQCSTSKCQDQSGSSNSGHGVSAGVVAGAVVGSIAFLALSVGLFLWWRRRNAAAFQPSVQEAKDIPAPADTVLNRPDPTEKVVVTPPTPNPVPNESVVRVYGNSNATINLDPTSQSSPTRSDSSHSNPFGDNHSIQTTSTGSQSTNVIPIAFVPPPASMLPSGSLPLASSTSLVHNSGAPRVELNMDHMNLSVESVPLNSASPLVLPQCQTIVPTSQMVVMPAMFFQKCQRSSLAGRLQALPRPPLCLPHPQGALRHVHLLALPSLHRPSAHKMYCMRPMRATRCLSWLIRSPTNDPRRLAAPWRHGALRRHPRI